MVVVPFRTRAKIFYRRFTTSSTNGFEKNERAIPTAKLRVHTIEIHYASFKANFVPPQAIIQNECHVLIAVFSVPSQGLTLWLDEEGARS